MNKYSFFVFFIYLGCTLVFPNNVAAELKVGFVNAIKVMDKAPQVEAANKRLEQEFEPKQRRLVSARQEIRNMEESYGKNVKIMSDNEARRQRRKIREKQREFERQQEEFREDYNYRRNEELDKIQKVIIEIIQKLAKEKSYDFILTDGVVWASQRVDITDEVLKQLEDHR